MKNTEIFDDKDFIIETITPEEATKRLRVMGMSMSPETMRAGIIQGVYPFGDVVQCEKGPKFTIYCKKFYDWVREVGRKRESA